jgi:hypothetical protein
MRKQEEDEDPANHDNRSLTPRMKQFMTSDPKGKMSIISEEAMNDW